MFLHASGLRVCYANGKVNDFADSVCEIFVWGVCVNCCIADLLLKKNVLTDVYISECCFSWRKVGKGIRSFEYRRYVLGMLTMSGDALTEVSRCFFVGFLMEKGIFSLLWGRGQWQQLFTQFVVLEKKALAPLIFFGFPLNRMKEKVRPLAIALTR